MLFMLVLSSLNTITKEPAAMATILGRPSPHPRLGAPVELCSGHTGGLFNLLGISKALAS